MSDSSTPLATAWTPGRERKDAWLAVIAFSFRSCHDQHRQALMGCQEQPLRGWDPTPSGISTLSYLSVPMCPTFADGEH